METAWSGVKGHRDLRSQWEILNGLHLQRRALALCPDKEASELIFLCCSGSFHGLSQWAVSPWLYKPWWQGASWLQGPLSGEEESPSSRVTFPGGTRLRDMASRDDASWDGGPQAKVAPPERRMRTGRDMVLTCFRSERCTDVYTIEESRGLILFSNFKHFI